MPVGAEKALRRQAFVRIKHAIAGDTKIRRKYPRCRQARSLRQRAVKDRAADKMVEPKLARSPVRRGCLERRKEQMQIDSWPQIKSLLWIFRWYYRLCIVCAPLFFENIMNSPATPSAPSARTRVRRLAARAHYDHDSVAAIAQASLVCHVAFADSHGVHCIPTSCWCHGEHLYIHGSNGSRMLKALAAGEACVTLTHVDGLVLARSAFHHSMNYRSVVAYGRFERIENDEEKMESLEAFIEMLAPGRWAQVRQPTRNELAATTVMRLPLTEAAAKVRNWGVKDDEADMAHPVWAGVVPLRMTALAPEPDAGCGAMPSPRIGIQRAEHADQPQTN